MRDFTLRTIRRNRRGAVAALMAILISTLVIVGAMAINLGYMQLTRAELMVATDAAARSGGRAMSFYQDVEDAKVAAQSTAALNTVAGETLRLSLSDSHNQIEFGDSADAANTDRFGFIKKQTWKIASGRDSANSVRVSAAISKVPLIFPNLSSTQDFDVGYQSVAMQVDRDIALVLDRSGSMDWPDYDWPSHINPWSSTNLNKGVQEGILYKRRGRYYYSSGQNSRTYQDWLWEYEYELGEPPGTPWENLKEAVAVFLNVLDGTDQSELVSLATYSSSATLDWQLESDYSKIIQELNTKYPSGSTAIGEGLEEAFPSLISALARPFAAKTIIVMTDGIHNNGVDPETVAQTVVNQHDVTIHTVTFGSGADIQRMRTVANIGGGSHFHAADGDELVEVFETIANNLPTIVTQ